MHDLDFVLKGTVFGMLVLFSFIAFGLLMVRLFSEKAKSARVGHFLIRARVIRLNENGDARAQATYYADTRDGKPSFTTRMACGLFYNDFTAASNMANDLRLDFEDRFGNSTAKIDIIEKYNYPLVGEVWNTVATR